MKRVLLAGVLGVLPAFSQAALLTNSWTNSAGGFWHVGANWSAGAAPALSNAAVVITNATAKTVTLNALTPNLNRTISNLLVSAPVGVVNRLQLTNTGTVTPLRILNGFTLGSRGELLASNSFVHVDGISGGAWTNDGRAVLLNGGFLFTTNVAAAIGATGVGSLVISGGAMIARSQALGNSPGARGILTMTAGTNSAASFFSVGEVAGATGEVWISGGQFYASGTEADIGFSGVGRMTVSNGTILVTNLCVGCNAGSQGTFSAAGGTNTLLAPSSIGNGIESTGAVWVTGGLLTATDGFTFIGQGGSGQMSVSNGIVRLLDTSVGEQTGARGTLTVAGGTLDVAGELDVGFDVAATGAVWITGGQLVTTNVFQFIGVEGAGRMTVSNGEVRALGISVGVFEGGKGTLTIAGGTNRLASALEIAFDTNSVGAVWVTGGQLVVTNDFTFVGAAGAGQLTVSNGTVLTRETSVGELGVARGTFTIAGGTNICSSSLDIGFETGATGVVWVTAGALTATNGLTQLGSRGFGQLTVSNGLVRFRDLQVASNTTARGAMLVAGGTVTASQSLRIGDNTCAAAGTVTVAGGRLYVTNTLATAVLDVRSGTVTLSSGELRVDRLFVTNACGRFVRTGGTLVTNMVTLTPGFDADGDGMPNSFEAANGLDRFNPADASLDADGDGLTSLQEFLAGTSPTNNASALRITAIVREANNLRVTWATVAGKTNALQVAMGSVTNNFTDRFIVTNTTGTITNYLDMGGATNLPARYYRVRLVP